ncbi:MAG: EAL domain-containing protein [Rhizobiaceae bacterium]|nr:EAL domain-containing protein [Rhizobiaceae bacterium]
MIRSLKVSKLLRDAVIAVSCTVLFSLLAMLIHDRWQRQYNNEALKTLATNALKQVEYNVDYAILTAFEVADKAPVPCAAEALNIIQNIVHSGSNIKDVIILGSDGQQLCSAFSGSGRMFDVSAGVPALNENYALHKLFAADREFLGISWKAPDQLTYVIGVDLAANRFGAFPSEIRDNVREDLSVTGLGEFGNFGRELDSQHSVSVVSSSGRFPVTAELRLDNTSLANWNGENRRPLITLGAALGLLVSGLVIRELRRPTTPRESLRQAMINLEIVPYAQATFDLATRQVTGCEILMRWIKPDGSVIPPVHFVPLAEATGMIVPMTRHVMKIALESFALYLRRNSAFTVAFNIVPTDFTSEGFEKELLQLTNHAGVATRQVVLEITERQAIDDINEFRSAVARVRGLGFKIALDDMGTGHNGLSSVQDVALDVIKIDKKFVDVVGKEPVADAIIELLVGLARRLGMRIIAEGIETETQLEALVKAGVTNGQGYLVAKPVPIETFLWLQTQTESKPKQDGLGQAA